MRAAAGRLGMGVAVIAIGAAACGAPPEQPRDGSDARPPEPAVATYAVTDTSSPLDAVVTEAYVEQIRLREGIGRYVVCGRTSADSLQMWVQIERDQPVPITPVAVRDGRFRAEFTIDLTTDEALAYTEDEAGFAVLGLPENGPVEYVPFPLAGPSGACGDGVCGSGTDSAARVHPGRCGVT
jgi:hypothetical protein